jgi:hypothetical protein
MWDVSAHASPGDSMDSPQQRQEGFRQIFDDRIAYPSQPPRRPTFKRQITGETILFSSPLATLIYTAASTAADLPFQDPSQPACQPTSNKKGNVLRRKRAQGKRPDRLNIVKPKGSFVPPVF